MFPMFPRTGFPTMLRRQGCDAAMLRRCLTNASPRALKASQVRSAGTSTSRPWRGAFRGAAGVPGVPDDVPDVPPNGVPNDAPTTGLRRCSGNRVATGLRRGCDGAATGLRRCRTNASGCSPDDAPATAPERTTGTHRSPRNAPSWSSSWPGATSRHVHPPAAAGGVQLPGSPAMFPRRCWTFPTMVPAMVSAIGNVPERPPVPASQVARLPGCH